MIKLSKLREKCPQGDQSLALDLLLKMIEENPDARITPAIKHKYFHTNNNNTPSSRQYVRKVIPLFPELDRPGSYGERKTQ